MAAKKNLEIIGHTVGAYKAGDIVPAYALAAANPENIVEHGLAKWTDDPATVSVNVETLTAAAPDATPGLIQAHSRLTAEHKQLTATVETLHAKCLDLEKKNESLAAELAAKVEEIGTVKSQREKALADLEDMKLLAEAATAPKENGQPK